MQKTQNITASESLDAPELVEGELLDETGAVSAQERIESEGEGRGLFEDIATEPRLERHALNLAMRAQHVPPLSQSHGLTHQLVSESARAESGAEPSAQLSAARSSAEPPAPVGSSHVSGFAAAALIPELPEVALSADQSFSGLSWSEEMESAPTLHFRPAELGLDLRASGREDTTEARSRISGVPAPRRSSPPSAAVRTNASERVSTPSFLNLEAASVLPPVGVGPAVQNSGRRTSVPPAAVAQVESLQTAPFASTTTPALPPLAVPALKTEKTESREGTQTFPTLPTPSNPRTRRDSDAPTSPRIVLTPELALAAGRIQAQGANPNADSVHVRPEVTPSQPAVVVHRARVIGDQASLAAVDMGIPSRPPRRLRTHVDEFEPLELDENSDVDDGSRFGPQRRSTPGASPDGAGARDSRSHRPPPPPVSHAGGRRHRSSTPTIQLSVSAAQLSEHAQALSAAQPAGVATPPSVATPTSATQPPGTAPAQPTSAVQPANITRPSSAPTPSASGSAPQPVGAAPQPPNASTTQPTSVVPLSASATASTTHATPNTSAHAPQPSSSASANANPAHASSTGPQRFGPPPPPPPSHQLGGRKPGSSTKPRIKKRAWWEVLFSDDYIRTLPRVAPAATSKQVSFMEASLGIKRGDSVLDVGCGLGHHALEFARRGYLVVALDLALPMITRAAEEAQQRGLRINFLHKDIRDIGFEGTFDAIVCTGTTFGFFDDEQNRNVLVRLAHALKPGGRLLLDVVNRDFVIGSQPNLVWFEGDGCVVMEETDFNYYSSRLTVKRTMMREDGRQSEVEYNIRLYSIHELGQLLKQVGFSIKEVSGQEATRGLFFGAEAKRIIILAERRARSRSNDESGVERA